MESVAPYTGAVIRETPKMLNSGVGNPEIDSGLHHKGMECGPLDSGNVLYIGAVAVDMSKMLSSVVESLSQTFSGLNVSSLENLILKRSLW